MKFKISLSFLLLFSTTANSLYFLLESGKEKCVFDDIPKNQVSKKNKKNLMINFRK